MVMNKTYAAEASIQAVSPESKADSSAKDKVENPNRPTASKIAQAIFFVCIFITPSGMKIIIIEGS